MAEPTKADLAVRTFDELCAELRVTPEERKHLVYHLAALRFRKTLEALLPRHSDCVKPGSCRGCPGCMGVKF